MVADKGPQRQWLTEIGKVDVCDGWTPQNAAHLQAVPVGGRWERAVNVDT